MRILYEPNVSLLIKLIRNTCNVQAYFTGCPFPFFEDGGFALQERLDYNSTMKELHDITIEELEDVLYQ